MQEVRFKLNLFEGQGYSYETRLGKLSLLSWENRRVLTDVTFLKVLKELIE